MFGSMRMIMIGVMVCLLSAYVFKLTDNATLKANQIKLESSCNRAETT